ncbi:MAG: right-handed parallel beta-helix repeat-containing protein [Chloroflexi bacterium]|nr:right-handed parallel beta-helix repeat-containing protein [Chloroflexota bacterium]
MRNALSTGTTLFVAAANSSPEAKAQANYVADGTADDVEIQAAINVVSASGGTVKLAQGTYNTISTIVLTAATVRLVGSGWSTQVNCSADNCIRMGNLGAIANDIKIANLSLSNAMPFGNGISIRGTGLRSVEQVRINTEHDGIEVYRARGPTYIKGSELLNNGFSGIRIYGYSGIYISEVYVHHNSLAGIRAESAYGGPPRGVLIENSLIAYNGHHGSDADGKCSEINVCIGHDGVLMTGDASDWYFNKVIFMGNNEHGLYAQGSNVQISNSKFSGNYSGGLRAAVTALRVTDSVAESNKGPGFHLEGTSTAYLANLVAQSNGADGFSTTAGQISPHDSAGINLVAIDNGQNGFRLPGVINFTCTNCSAIGNGRAGVYSEDNGIRLFGTGNNFWVTGGTVKDNSGWGIISQAFYVGVYIDNVNLSGNRNGDVSLYGSNNLAVTRASSDLEIKKKAKVGEPIFWDGSE